MDLFLSRDEVAPGALTFMSDRAVRRLCDRPIALGAVRELTGRDSFRFPFTWTGGLEDQAG